MSDDKTTEGNPTKGITLEHVVELKTILSEKKLAEVQKIFDLLSQSTEGGTVLPKEGTMDPFTAYIQELDLVREFNTSIKNDQGNETIANKKGPLEDYYENVKNIIKYYLDSTTNESLENRLDILKELIRSIEVKFKEVLDTDYNLDTLPDLNKNLEILTSELVFLNIIFTSFFKWYRAPINSPRYRLGGLFIHDFSKPVVNMRGFLSAVNPVTSEKGLKSFNGFKKHVYTYLEDFKSHISLIEQFIEEEVTDNTMNFTTFFNLKKTIDLNNRKIELIINGLPAEDFNFGNIDQWISIHTLLLNSIKQNATVIKLEVVIQEPITTISIWDNSTNGEWPKDYENSLIESFKLGFKYPEFPGNQNIRGGQIVAFLKGQEAARKYRDKAVDLEEVMHEYILLEGSKEKEGQRMKSITVNFQNTEASDINK